MTSSKSVSLALFALAAALLLATCNVSHVADGGGTETGNPTVVAMVRNPGGTPAKHARVRFYPVGYNPRTGLAKALAAVDSAVTDTNGNYAATLDTGKYNVLAAGDSGVLFQDSITVLKDTTIHPPADTLKAPGSLIGVIRLQPGDDARKVFILVMGTNSFASPSDPAGNFGLANIADGRYSVRILSILDNYGVLDTSLAVRAGRNDTLADTIVLPYTGIPVPSGLKISYDTLKQIVTLSWKKPTTGRTVAGYNIYRKQQDSSFVKIKSAVTDTTFSDSTLRASANYEYRVTVIDTQNTEGVQSSGIIVGFLNRFRLITSAAAFGRRQEHSSVAFNAKMWVIAGTDGYNLKNDVWFSTDGISWIQATDSASFSRRRGHTSVVFNNKMWVIGGLADIRGGGLDSKNDVWYSTDGVSWIQDTIPPSDSIFSGRSGHASIVFDNKIWVIGGSLASGGMLNDVWYSADGTSWTQTTSAAGFDKRLGHRLFIFANEMWLIGGNDNSGFKNDVWNTKDGVIWNEVSSSSGFAARYGFTVDVLDSTIWLVGGYGMPGGTLGPYDDAWYSTNGALWRQFNIPPNLTAKHNQSAVVFLSELWIIGANNSSASDVWSLK